MKIDITLDVERNRKWLNLPQVRKIILLRGTIGREDSRRIAIQVQEMALDILKGEEGDISDERWDEFNLEVHEYKLALNN